MPTRGVAETPPTTMPLCPEPLDNTVKIPRLWLVAKVLLGLLEAEVVSDTSLIHLDHGRGVVFQAKG